MLDFIPGPNGERISPKDQKYIRESLSPNSFSYHVNSYYNNSHHFSAPYTYDIIPFLKEVQRIKESTVHTLQIMGGVHTDPYGHTSGLIGQYDEYNEYFPAIMKDTYIRFKVLIKSQIALHALNTINVFHYMISAPHIVKLQLGVKVPVTMIQVPQDFVPTSAYKHAYHVIS